MNFVVKAYGSQHWLVSADVFEDFSLRQRLDAAFQVEPPNGYLEHVWGAYNLMLAGDVALNAVDLERWFREQSLSAGLVDGVEMRDHEILVDYTGPDLLAVAEQIHCSVDELIHLHTAAEYRVRMLGFSPGFPYLDGLDSRLHLPRRRSPRVRIEPGAVAIGGAHAGIYTVPSPGGWHLLGQTRFELFKQANLVSGAASDVFTLRVGDRVRFKAL